MIELGTAITALKTIAGVVKNAGKIDLTHKVIVLQQTLPALISDNMELRKRIWNSRGGWMEL